MLSKKPGPDFRSGKAGGRFGGKRGQFTGITGRVTKSRRTGGPVG
jgi:hypothetical protein